MSADDRFVFRMALAAAPFQLPVIGARLPNEDSTIHLSGLVFFWLILLRRGQFTNRFNGRGFFPCVIGLFIETLIFLVFVLQLYRRENNKLIT
jgi:lipopolysaccharide export LptBFGC system permease protein LptF